MKLIFWTAADSKTISSVIGRALLTYRPNVPDHSFVEYAAGVIPQPKEGTVVIVCGSKPLDVLKHNGVFKKHFSLSKLRETPVKSAYGGWYLVTYDPSIVANEPDKRPVIEWDIRLAVRLLSTGTTKPVLGSYKWVGSYAPMIGEIKKRAETEGKVRVSFDSESEGLYPWYSNKNMVSLSFTLDAGTAECLYVGAGPDPVPISPSLRDEVEWLFQSPLVKMTLANGKFDLIWLAEKFGIECTNFTTDTLLIGSLLDENRSNGLKMHAKTMTNMGGYDDDLNTNYDIGHMEKVPLDVLLKYQGGDTDVTQQCAEVLVSELSQDPELAAFYVTILHPAARAFEKIERRGVLVDQEAYAVLGDDLRKEVKELETKALELLPMKLRYKMMSGIEKQLSEGKSPFTAAVLQEFYFGPSGLNLKPFMKTEKTGAPSTAKAHLKMFADHPLAGEMTQLQEQIGSAQKTLGTYVDGFLKHLRPDGRFHPSYMLFHGALYDDDSDDDSGSVTGRLSAKDPAFQTIPKKTKWAKRIRDCFVAPEGKVILQCVDPNTKIWNADLTWSIAGDVKVGQRLFGFDEQGNGKHRKMREAIVTDVTRQIVPRVRITLDDGTELVCARHHKWLGYRGSLNTWLRADRLHVGSILRRVSRVVEKEDTFEAGWLSGMFDGEGWLSGRHGDGWAMGIAQKKGPVFDRLRTCLEARGYQTCTTPNGSGVPCLRVSSTWQVFDLLQRLRPERLVNKRTWEGFALPRHGAHKGECKALVVAVEMLTPGEVVTIKTNTSTFVAEGIASHNCDYSQGELKVVACVANEKNMLKAYSDGLDLHAVTGSRLGGVTYEEFLKWKTEKDKKLAALYDDLRTRAKAGNFGLLYGMGVDGFIAYAWANYGLKLTYEEAEKIRSEFFTAYPGLLTYHDRMRNLAHKFEQVRSPLGRIRHLPTVKSWDKSVVSKAERQAINSPIQSCLSDMMLWAIALIDAELPGDVVETVGMIHDASMFYVPEADVGHWAGQIQDIMGNLPFADLGWQPQLKFTADAEYGPTLAKLQKL